MKGTNIPKKLPNMFFYGKNIAKTFAIATLVGTLSYILVLVIGYTITLSHLFDFQKGYYMKVNNQKLWLIYSIITQVGCMIGCFFSFFIFGSNKAIKESFRVFSPRKTYVMILMEVGFGIILHGAFCALISRMSMSYLIFASPVQYIACYMGKAGRSLFSDIAFSFSNETMFRAILVYIAGILLSAMVGAIIGYRHKRRMLSEEFNDI